MLIITNTVRSRAMIVTRFHLWMTPSSTGSCHLDTLGSITMDALLKRPPTQLVQVQIHWIMVREKIKLISGLLYEHDKLVENMHITSMNVSLAASRQKKVMNELRDLRQDIQQIKQGSFNYCCGLCNFVFTPRSKQIEWLAKDFYVYVE